MEKIISYTFSTILLSAVACFIAGCGSTTPVLGGGSGYTVTGAAAGSTSEGANKALEYCDESLGTLALVEDQSSPWWGDYYQRYPRLGSTVPVLRTMVQQSNCFVVVERGRAMSNMMQERQLMESGEMRSGSNFGKGQMVAADYTMSPNIQFSEKGTGGVGAVAGTLLRSSGFSAIAGAAGGLKSNEASTTLLLVDNRSGVQISSSIGSAKNFDFRLFGVGWGGGAAGGLGGYTNTPEGKIITASFADSYNKMVRSLRQYKAQTVKGGLGKGGQLKVSD